MPSTPSWPPSRYPGAWQGGRQRHDRVPGPCPPSRPVSNAVTTGACQGGRGHGATAVAGFTRLGRPGYVVACSPERGALTGVSVAGPQWRFRIRRGGHPPPSHPPSLGPGGYWNGGGVWGNIRPLLTDPPPGGRGGGSIWGPDQPRPTPPPRPRQKNYPPAENEI